MDNNIVDVKNVIENIEKQIDSLSKIVDNYCEHAKVFDENDKQEVKSAKTTSFFEKLKYSYDKFDLTFDALYAMIYEKYEDNGDALDLKKRISQTPVNDVKKCYENYDSSKKQKNDAQKIADKMMGYKHSVTRILNESFITAYNIIKNNRERMGLKNPETYAGIFQDYVIGVDKDGDKVVIAPGKDDNIAKTTFNQIKSICKNNGINEVNFDSQKPLLSTSYALFDLAKNYYVGSDTISSLKNEVGDNLDAVNNIAALLTALNLEIAILDKNQAKHIIKMFEYHIAQQLDNIKVDENDAEQSKKIVHLLSLLVSEKTNQLFDVFEENKLINKNNLLQKFQAVGEVDNKNSNIALCLTQYLIANAQIKENLQENINIKEPLKIIADCLTNVKSLINDGTIADKDAKDLNEKIKEIESDAKSFNGVHAILKEDLTKFDGVLNNLKIISDKLINSETLRKIASNDSASPQTGDKENAEEEKPAPVKPKKDAAKKKDDKVDPEIEDAKQKLIEAQKIIEEQKRELEERERKLEVIEKEKEKLEDKLKNSNGALNQNSLIGNLIKELKQKINQNLNKILNNAISSIAEKQQDSKEKDSLLFAFKYLFNNNENSLEILKDISNFISLDTFDKIYQLKHCVLNFCETISENIAKNIVELSTNDSNIPQDLDSLVNMSISELNNIFISKFRDYQKNEIEQVKQNYKDKISRQILEIARINQFYDGTEEEPGFIGKIKNNLLLKVFKNVITSELEEIRRCDENNTEYEFTSNSLDEMVAKLLTQQKNAKKAEAEKDEMAF